MRSPLLWLALTLHVVLATAYAWFTPAFEGPDENSHYEYAWHIANAGDLPYASSYVVEHGLHQLDGVEFGHHPPLYPAIVGGVLRLAGRDDTVFGPRLNADLAAVLLACLPMWSAMHGLLSNDVLATTLTTATLLQLATMLRRGAVQNGAAAGLGLLLGAALLTKLTTLFLLGLAGLVAIVIVFRARSDARRTQLVAIGITIAVTAAVCGWTFVRNSMLYGDPLAMNAHDASFQPIPDPLRWHNLFGTGPWPAGIEPVIPTVFTSLLGRFGWFELRPHPALPWTAAGVLTLALLGLLRATLDRRRPTAYVPRHTWLLLCAALLVLAGTLWFNVRVYSPQARLLFPGAAPVAVLLAAGLLRITDGAPRRRALLVLPPLVAAAAFFSTFLPGLDRTLAPAPIEHRTLVGGIVDAPAATPIEWRVDQADEPLTTAPTLRWHDAASPPAGAGTRYSLYAFDDRGRVWLATHEWLNDGCIITGSEFTIPEQVWTFLPHDLPLHLRLRRLPTTPTASPHRLPASTPLTIVRS